MDGLALLCVTETAARLLFCGSVVRFGSLFYPHLLISCLDLKIGQQTFLTSGHSALHNIASHPCPHSHPDAGVAHAGPQPARQEESGGGVWLRDTSTLS